MTEPIQILIIAKDMASTAINKVKTSFVSLQTGIAGASYKINSSLKNMEYELGYFSLKVKDASEKMRTMKQDMEGVSGMGSALMLSLTPIAGVLGAISAISLKTASDFEQQRIAFTTLTKDAGVAEDLMLELKRLSLTTPMQYKDIIQYAKELMGMGIAATQVTQDIRMLGDAAAGVGMDKMPALVLAFGQVAAKTRVMGQELTQQFANTGIPIIEKLAEKFGVTSKEILKMTELGKISFDDLREAMATINPGAMEKQMQSLAGKVSNLSDALFFLRNAIGEPLLKPAKMIVDMFVLITNKFNALSAQTKLMISSLLVATTVVASLGAALGTVAFFLPSIISGLTILGATGISAFGWVGLAASAVAILTTSLISVTNMGETSFDKFSKYIKGIASDKELEAKKQSILKKMTEIKDILSKQEDPGAKDKGGMLGLGLSQKQISDQRAKLTEMAGQIVAIEDELAEREKTRNKEKETQDAYLLKMKKQQQTELTEAEKKRIEKMKKMNQEAIDDQLFDIKRLKDGTKESAQDQIDKLEKLKLKYPELREKLNDYIKKIQQYRDDTISSYQAVEQKTNNLSVADEEMRLKLKSISRETTAVGDTGKKAFGDINDELNNTITLLDSSNSKVTEFQNIGRSLAKDVPTGLKDLLDSIFFGDDGFVNNLGNNIKKMIGTSFSSGVTDVTNDSSVKSKWSEFISGLFKGFVGQIILNGLFGIITGIFGSSPVKTVAEIAEDSFNIMVDNVNNKLDEIGKEKTLTDKQIDLVEKYMKQKNLKETAIAPAELLKGLGFDVTTQMTFKDIIQKLADKQISLTNQIEETRKTAIQDAIDKKNTLATLKDIVLQNKGWHISPAEEEVLKQVTGGQGLVRTWEGTVDWQASIKVIDAAMKGLGDVITDQTTQYSENFVNAQNELLNLEEILNGSPTTKPTVISTTGKINTFGGATTAAAQSISTAGSNITPISSGYTGSTSQSGGDLVIPLYVDGSKLAEAVVKNYNQARGSNTIVRFTAA